MNKYLEIMGLIGILMFLVACSGCDRDPTSPTPTDYYEIKGRSPTPIEQELLDSVNTERKAYGLDELAWGGGLANLALAQSEDMYERQYFSHWNPENEGPSDRARLGHAGSHKFDPIIPPYYSIGENIACGYPDVASVMEAWMNSPEHRANILSPSYTHIGIGYYRGEETKYIDWIWTQDFATRNPDVIIITGD